MLIMHVANYTVGCAGCPVLSYTFHIVQNLNETFKCNSSSSNNNNNNNNLKLLEHIIKDVRNSVLSNTLIKAL